jgi:hypothetical protein
LIMASIMVYGMVVYNIARNMGNMTNMTNMTFFHALAELPIMVPIAFILEFFIVGKLAHQLAFMVVRPSDRPQIITYAISICICCIMCPIMSFIACLLFNRNQMSFAFWIKTWALNFPVAILYQLFYCGPLVRLIFRIIFSKKEQSTNF